jgi:small-conductance mechanosensitive channel
MDRLPDIGAWRDVLLQAATELGTKVAGFLPSLLGAVVILLLGWLLSRSVELAAGRGLRTFGLDRAATRLRLTDVLQRAGIEMAPSEVVARLLFWLLMLTFLLSSVETLGLTAVTATIDRLIAYIPNLIGAALIALLGLLLARFLGSVASSASAAAGFPSAPRLGFLVQVFVAGLVIVVAVEQLGVATNVLVGPLTALLAAAGLSAGLAFALGAYPIVTHILAGHFLKASLPRDTFVEVEGERGVVERIGATDTLLRNGERVWSVPNAKLLNLVVAR